MGESRAMRCPSCGQENPERAKFCLECGTALTAAGAPPASQESRRTVTVVFADMVGFTSLGESLDQESLRRVMDRFYAEMRSAIEAQAGTLAKFIGDAVLAVWGTPQVHEDDALRAVRAADAMRGALAGLNEELQTRWGVRVGMRTGVNTGEVVVDPTRPADLLVGDTLNVAARLEQAAADGEVLVGPETYRLVRDETTLEPVEPLVLKGKAKPMPAWRVIDATRRERRAESRLQAPLVGRSSELASLWAAFTDVAESRRCRMTTIIGSPGLGKTRLVGEFIRSVADQATVLHGRCEATGEGITFQPVAEVLRAAAQIGEDDAPELARDKLGALLPADEPDRDRVVERAAALLGLAPIASTEETFWAMRRILEALARERPVVLVHDDIHWGQPTFLDLLEHFVEWIRDAPVLVLALARPELREVRASLAEPDGLAGVLSLEPLDAAASRAMVSGLLGAADLPEGLAQRILETTEGNPLFLGETLRMLADEGVLRREGDTWVAGDITNVVVPPTINALLSTRIQRLEGDERSVVERAAVIGHAFYRGAVTELAPAAVKPAVGEALETLTRKELVRAEDEWWLDEQVFRFHHVLIRDAAYRSLLKENRADLHERFADWLEAKAGDMAGEHEEVVAFHLEQAHAYRMELGQLDDEGRVLAARAAARLHSAGSRALAREDLPAATNLLRRALTPMAENLAGRLEVLVDLAETLLSAGDTGAAEQVVEELGLGADELGDARLRARAVVFATQLDNLTGAGRVRASADEAARAAETLAAAGDRAGEAKAHQVVAQAEALLGQVAAAESALDRALVAARLADDRRRITAVLSGAPRAALWGPAPIVRASGRCLDVVRILRMTPGNRHVEAAALRCQAVLEAMRGRADAARGILDACRVTLEELGLTLELHETAAHAGLVELLAGDPAAAEAHLHAAAEGFGALGVEASAAQAAALEARALVEQGRDDEALEASARAAAAGGEDLKTRTAWLGARAEVLARRGEHAEALRLAQSAVDLTEPTDALADRADALMALAAVSSAAGDEPAARAAAERARELYAAKDHTVGVARAEAIAGRSPGAAPAAAATARAADLPAYLEAFVAAHRARDWEALRALYSDDFRMVDHRQIGIEPSSADEVVAMQRAVVDVSPAYEMSAELLAHVGDVMAWVRTWHDPEGMLENVFGMVTVLRGDRAVRNEIFEPEDEVGMLRRFQELAADQDLGAALGNAARFFAAFNDRDEQRVAALVADDFQGRDRRRLGWADTDGPDGVLAGLRSRAGHGEWAVYVRRVRAETGDAVLLEMGHRGQAPDGGGAVAEDMLMVIRVRDGRMTRRESFEVGDEQLAVAALRALPLAGDLPERAYARFAEAYNARDWGAVRAAARDDVWFADRREVGWERTLGIDAFLAFLESTVQAGPDLEFRVENVIATGDRAIALTSLSTAHGEAGAEFVIALGHVTTFDEDGRFASVEFWDPGDEAAMRARLDELAGPLEIPWLLRVSGRAWAEAFSARDWERLGAFYAPDVILRDHRQGLRHESRGRADVIATLAEASPINGHVVRYAPIALPAENVVVIDHALGGDADEGGAEWEMVLDQVVVTDDDQRIALVEIFDDRAALLARGQELVADPLPPLVLRHVARSTSAASPIATAGERVAVTTGDHGLDVIEVDAEGAVRRTEAIETGSEAEALALMDRWAGERPLALAPWIEPTPAVELYGEWAAAFNARDLAGMEARQHPDATTHDHRPGIRHSIDGRDAATAIWEWLWREVPDVRLRAVVLQAAPEAVHVRQSFTSRGSDYEIRFDCVTEVVDGLGRRTDLFEAGDPEAAARFEELVSAEPLPVRLARRWEEIFNSRDWERARLYQAPGYISDDRRPLGGGMLVGGEEGITSSKAMLEVSPDIAWHFEPIEAGDDAGIFRTTVSGHGLDGGAFSVTTLQVVVAARGGLTDRNVVFDLTQEAEAWAEYRAWAAHLAQARFQDELMSAADFDRVLAEMYAPGFSQTDFRAAGAPVLDAEAMVASLREAFAMAPDTRVETDVVAVAGDRRVQRLTFRGHLEAGGGELELELWTLTRISGMRNAGSDIYPSREEAEAALAADEAAGEPAVAGVVRRLEDAVAALDFEAMASLFAEDYLWTSHQAGKREETRGRPAAVEGMRAACAGRLVEGVRLRAELLDSRGSRGLFRETWTGSFRGGPFETTALVVRGLDADGRLHRDHAFDLGDAEAAQAILAGANADARGSAIRFAEGVQPTPITALVDRFVGILGRRDPEELAGAFAPDFRHEDHRPGMRHVIEGSAENARNWTTSLAPFEDFRADVLVLRATADVVHMAISFRSAAAGFEISLEQVGTARGERFMSADIYEPGAPAAVARFAHHVHLRELETAINQGAYDRLRDELLTDDFVQEDRRSVGASEVADVEGFLTLQRTAREVVPDLICEFVLRDVAGDVRLARVTFTGTAAGGGEVALTFWSVAELRDGRLARSIMFDGEEEARRALEDHAAGFAS
jgi:class 3 adenylate cyclase/ketosteroid isomerase-like protein